MIKPYAQLANEGAHAAILHTILWNFTILATQRGPGLGDLGGPVFSGGHGPMAPLHTPLLLAFLIDPSRVNYI